MLSDLLGGAGGGGLGLDPLDEYPLVPFSGIEIIGLDLTPGVFTSDPFLRMVLVGLPSKLESDVREGLRSKPSCELNEAFRSCSLKKFLDFDECTISS